jgi:hypothetical protein
MPGATAVPISVPRGDTFGRFSIIVSTPPIAILRRPRQPQEIRHSGRNNAAALLPQRNSDIFAIMQSVIVMQRMQSAANRMTVSPSTSAHNYLGNGAGFRPSNRSQIHPMSSK